MSAAAEASGETPQFIPAPTVELTRNASTGRYGWKIRTAAESAEAAMEEALRIDGDLRRRTAEAAAEVETPEGLVF